MTGGRSRTGRLAGLLVPLSSCPSTHSWGIGEFPDVPALAGWMRDAGLRLLQLLPLNEMAAGQSSPYSATSALALDPIFIAVPAVADFDVLGGEQALDAASRDMLADVKAATRVDYSHVRAIKSGALRAAFERFRVEEWARDSARAADLRRFADEQRWWLDDHALYRALQYVAGGKEWQAWPAGIRDRDPEALVRARRDLDQEILFRQYLQWIAHDQWQSARAAVRDIRVFGDFPFGVSADSADVWAHQDLFSFDGTIGAPPDAFSDEGQNWRLPMYRWDVMAARRYEWFAARARRAADLFDGYRVDHVVGLFRTWMFPPDDRPPHFLPSAEADQILQGQAVLQVLMAGGADVVAEDLGTIPDFVRAALRTLNIPGYRVLRWEREWLAPGRPFRDPCNYPACSVATSGTHDTDTLAAWWNRLDTDVRTAVLTATGATASDAGAGFGPALRDQLLEALYASGSDLLVLPIQDVFGWTNRINVPAVIDAVNWTWKLPWAVDRFTTQPEAEARAETLRTWGARHGRLP
ncbi:MAG: 4-alpha-glucanotransferase [Acidobacteria bacterium]|nr:4-alpha-glucanotransferase [Acidobacteriota bacterium]